MRTLTFLDKLPHPDVSEGLATHDPRFARVTRFADAGLVEEAADAAAALVEQGINDIRLMGYIVHAAFLEGGLDRLPEIFDGLHRMLTGSWDDIGPKERRGLHVDKCLAWLLDRIEAEIGYQQAKHGETWARWMRSPEAVSASLAALEKLTAGRSGDSQRALEEPSAKLRRVLREMTRQASVPVETLAEPVPEDPPPEEAGISARELGFDLVGSPRLADLLAKLHAFEVLTRQGDYRKAALVAADVQDIIDNFDPREYFPSLFKTFSTLLSEHVERIAPHWEQKDSVGWRTLEQFYRVDLDAFVGPES